MSEVTTSSTETSRSETREISIHQLLAFADETLSQNKTYETLKANTSFEWKAEPETFGGLTRDELTILTAMIGVDMGLTPEHAAKIKILFADAAGINNIDTGKMQIHLAVCLTQRDISGKFTESLIVINRAKEWLRFSDIEGERLKFPAFSTEHDNNLTSQEGKSSVDCEFEEGWEYVVWAVTEELNHARLNFIAETDKKHIQWDKKYQNSLAEKQVKVRNPYSLSVSEVTASRIAVKNLSKISSVINPNRVEYFKQIYEKSVRDNVGITPRGRSAIEQAMVNVFPINE